MPGLPANIVHGADHSPGAPPTGRGALRGGGLDGLPSRIDGTTGSPRPPIREGLGLAAYRLGRELNRLRWHLELIPLLRVENEKAVQASFSRLIPLLRHLVADPDGARI